MTFLSHRTHSAQGFKLFSVLLLAAILALFGWSVADRQARAANPPAAVLSLGGAITEIVYALGQGDRLIARDTTSTYPPEAEALPDVGYVRALSPEGVLSVGPDLILSEEGAGPPEAVEVIREASVPFVTVPERYSAEGVLKKIEVVGAALEVPDRAAVLSEAVGDALEGAMARAEARAGDRKRVLFILSTQGGRITAAGAGTGADALISMAGGVNALSDVEGYKPVSDEALVRAAPDVILMMDRGGDHGITDDALFSMPPLRLTPAGESRSVVRMDGLLLLGFGPRTAEAVDGLSAALYGEGS
ncbi:heme/hemin ABC transporter substrate-binding protein [Allosediminivita pacifica]|uniref:Iron complex transport system substrate-binding protein n=1 Tax=Allosediminivita pacifica TaxID=1267769 RepID=A0A2T6APB0_9RHOB|nr:ABC transporter substrate-binding protein [Allosediminivita pacifica]PTX45655.1 iron complex transport system substrate-binding protein [Allosediminivita pacifica]GGB06953.1 hemin ABC transporter substrate-binding protein [Allosediminivita pacifica]